MPKPSTFQKSSFTRDGKYYAESAGDIVLLDIIDRDEKACRRQERQQNMHYASRENDCKRRQEEDAAATLEWAILRGEEKRRLAAEKARIEKELIEKELKLETERILEVKIEATKKEPEIISLKELKNMNPKELKMVLGSRGLSKQGNRHELLKRLHEHESNREAKQMIGHSSKHVFSVFMREGFEETKDL